MNASIAFQLPHPKEPQSLEALMSRIASQQAWDAISVAVAYSSVSGVRQFYEIVRQLHPSASFRWLLGLDDYITQPGAIEFCATLPHAQLRVFTSRGGRSRFHPKLYLFENTSSRTNASIIIGSANLTAAALRRNCEAVAIVEARTTADTAHIGASFDSVWELGKEPSAAILEEYAANFKKHRKSRSFLIGSDPLQTDTTKKGEVLHSDAAEMDPSIANVCWIEVGKNTAMGRELEFKAEQALFFGLTPTGGPPEMRNFRVSSGNLVPLRLKYQGNAMWRLQMTSDIPEVAIGLRPLIDGKLQRSPFVAVFERNKVENSFRLAFVRASSRDFARIRAASKQLGTIGTTSTREYGWY